MALCEGITRTKFYAIIEVLSLNGNSMLIFFVTSGTSRLA